MKLLMFSVDQKILEEGSAARARTILYGSLTDRLDVILYSSQNHHKEQIAPNVFIYPTNTFFRPLYFWQAYLLGKRLIGEDTVITSQDGVTNFAALMLKWCFKVPLQIQIHTDFMSPYFIFGGVKNIIHYLGYRLGISYADCIRVVSKRIKNSIVNAHLRSKNPPLILPIFVETGQFSKPSSLDVHAVYPQFKKIVLMVSRLTPEKNISLALSVFADAVSDDPDVGLLIVGEGKEKEKLQRIASVLNLKDRLVFEPWQSGQRLPSYYKSADIFLLTSNYEGYGRSLVEAALSLCPIITTDVGLVSDVLSYESVLYAPVGDRKALSRHLRFALSHPREMKERAAKAITEVRANVISNREEYLKSFKAALDGCLINLKS